MKRSSFLGFFAISAVLATCVLIACQTPTSTNSASSPLSAATGSATLRAESQATNGPRRDLSRDEAQGGHILRKHVGQTEEQLRQRLERERNITGASTYTDRSTAEHAVGAAIAQSQSEIQNWLIQPGRHPNLVLDYDSDGSDWAHHESRRIPVACRARMPSSY